jgi:1,4-alpha-glucan branching enzyme
MTDRDTPINIRTGVAPSEIDAILRGCDGDPFALLGMHGGGGEPLCLRVFRPDVDAIAVIDAKNARRVAFLDRVHGEGLFAGVVPRRRKHFAYTLELTAGDRVWQEEDPYRFPPLLGEVDTHLMAEGRHRRLYERLGAHPRRVDGVDGVAFAVWAPNAWRVSIVGDFNDWDGRRHPMRKRYEAGVWELFVPKLARGTLYKFEIVGGHGGLLPLKADPLAFEQEVPPATASRVHGLPDTSWQDADWMAARHDRQALTAPISIYEVHLGSWRRADDGGLMDYDALAERLIPYVRELGFTHIEFMPVSEHPFTGSWGYQPIGLYAPSRRFGPPEAFARLVDSCHQAGLGVIVDWVPGHFPNDVHGLQRFDGTALYEHEDPRLGFHPDWNTLIYNFGRREVANFLQANAAYWLDRFHVDALRVDAVASMLYLDYSRKPGEWAANVHGGNENLEAIAFLRETNTRVFADFAGATMMAEESTAWPNVSRPVEHGGLGFGYKWNMGWMHDTLSYMSRDPVHRKHHQGEMTFGIDYAFSENFILPLSHDEVVHGKGSLLGKMPGDRWQKFANLRAYFAFMWAHPGKKLLFMGDEFAQEHEWNHDGALDWHLLVDAQHVGVSMLIRDLNCLYRETPALHERDCTADGFGWIDASNAAQSVLVFMRKGSDGTPPVVAVCNFTPVVRYDYRIGVPHQGYWQEVLNSDSSHYGGSNVGNLGQLEASDEGMHGQPASLKLTLPPLATLLLRPAA